LVSQALVDTGLSPSLGAARRSIAEGGVYVNNTKVSSEDEALEAYVLPSGMAVLRRGKKTLAGLFIE
jgi:tyrosyl-tRNA synthetase